MIGRCTNPNYENFPSYGGRGISVCSRWLNSFENFLADMGAKPRGYSIDRIDNDGNYEPGNCRWATAREQALNVRHNRIVRAFGEAAPLAEMAGRHGMSATTLSHRLKSGWGVEQALSTPVRPRRPKATARTSG